MNSKLFAPKHSSRNRALRHSCRTFVAGAIGLVFWTGILHAQPIVYVDPVHGSDGNSGTLSTPFATIARAIEGISGGGTIFLRGGVYSFAGMNRLILSAVGSETHTLCLWSYPGETPILDFSGQSNFNDIFKGGIELCGSYWHLKGLDERGARYSSGCILTGSHNLVEQCSFHANGQITFGSGLYVYGRGNGATSQNIILNCDAFDNYDTPTNGGNADGFDISQEIGPGNIVKGCRAWHNSDDGFDCWNASSAILFDSCSAFANGYGDGNGNGFKMGGGNPVAPAAGHTFRNCLAANNRTHGFDQNDNRGGLTLLNCTAYRNGGSNYNLSTSPTSGTHVVRNCIDFKSTWGRVISSPNIQTTNSWQMHSPVDVDFQSTDSTGEAGRQRNPDGRWTPSAFLHLAPGSAFIDRGTPTGIAYRGLAPDIGAFEGEEATVTKTMLPVLQISSGSLDFGAVPINQTRAMVIAFINNGNDTLRISDISIAGAVFTVQCARFTVSPGDTFRNEIHATSPPTPGKVHGDIVIVSNTAKGIDTITVVLTSILSSVKTTPIGRPEGFLLHQNYPNPFNPSTTIRFALPYASPVTMTIFDAAGRKVRDLIDETVMGPSLHAVVWDGTDIHGTQVASGQYLCQMVAGDFREIKPLVLLR